MILISRRQLSDRQRPLDADARIARVQAAFELCGVGLGVQIQQLAVFGQGLESVGEAFGNKQATPVRG